MASNAGKETGGGLPKAAIAGIAVAVVAVVAFVVLGQRRTFEPMAAGRDSMDFTLPDLDGKVSSLRDYRGKVVFLNFWATWCKPCEEEMPSMQALYESLKDKPFEIVAVSVDSEGPDVVKAFAKKYGITFKILHDRKGRIKEMYKTTGVPETFIIDQNGVVAEKVWGPRDWTGKASISVITDLLTNGPRPRGSYSVKKHGA
ncbi:MAG: TlpA family protein disulfide reductase [Deltaproteobacteria bacterium]|nr:TlpA family protein disulfide reductase [Deltaproteobacteria bacterium]